MNPTEATVYPPDWSKLKIRNAIDMKRGISWAANQEHYQPREGAVPVLRIGNVQEILETDDLIYLSGLKPKAVEQKRASTGWCIMIGSNGNRKRIGNAVLIKEHTDYVFASFLLAVRPRAGSNILPSFFYRWLTSSAVQAYLSNAAESTTGLANLSQSFFQAMVIGFPSPAEQEAIARVLDAMDATIERTRTAVKKAEKLRDSMLRRLLKEGVRKQTSRKTLAGLIPEDWKCEPLGKHISDGPSNGLYRPEADYGSRGNLIVRIDSFADGRIHDLEKLRRVFVEDKITDRFALREKDILINRVNALTHIGKSAIVPALNEETLFESNMMNLRCSDTLMPEYLILILCSDIARRHWLARAKSAVNQASINQRDVCSLQIPLPEPDEQRQIANIMEASAQHIQALKTKIKQQNRLKTALLQDLLTGKVRVGALAAHSLASTNS